MVLLLVAGVPLDRSVSLDNGMVLVKFKCGVDGGCEWLEMIMRWFCDTSL